ncbi:hypothetical protein AALO_G00278650 [Alosa alosa]|uniref:Protein TBATA n=1 Tax=Alosa alosa TaxID=278164 RepID=A0AAV6FJR8_9TELE|nr:protein TBATA isoform X1 [Alosa alosa]KAG5262765.1 hypothetical protein AALO_G00278650 [Alosa alosa]
MDSGESGTPASTCPDLSALKTQEAILNKRKAEDLSDQNPLQTCRDICKTDGRSSARFGALSHHSFFSRHNPHPQRVTHISGLNGNPVCMVNDDWYVNSPLCPHPLIAGRVKTSHRGPLPMHHFGFHLQQLGSKAGAALLSDAWKEELKDITAKVSMSTQAQDRREQQRADRTASGRKTQYSAQTGRILPPPTRSMGRYSTTTSLHRRTSTCAPAPMQPFQDQELMVLELLCQILQTDSLHLLQQWLLFARQQEKDLVMGLLQQAMADASFPSRPYIPGQSGASVPRSSLPPQRPPSLSRQPTQRRRARLCKTLELAEDTPERIGEAEVLQIHTAECAATEPSLTEAKPQQC